MTLFYSSHEFTMGGRSGGIPFHVTTGMPDWIFYAAIGLVLFIAVLVFLGMKKDSCSGLTEKEREEAAVSFLLDSLGKRLPFDKEKNKAKK